MLDIIRTEPTELTDAELDAVAAGQNVGVGNVVNVQLDNIANNNRIAVNVAALNSAPVFIAQP
jgi:hypothetical protein